MKMSSSQLEAFFALAQDKNFTKAAMRIGLSQPAFSQRISALESDLESTLVIREKQSISLTEIGQKLLNYCNIHNQLEQEFLSQLSNSHGIDGLIGQVRIAGYSSIMRSLLTPSLTKLLKKNPKLSIQTFSDELDDIPNYLKNSKADFIIHNMPTQKEGLKCKLLGTEEYVLVRSKKHKDIEIYLDHDQNDLTTEEYFKLTKRKSPKNKRYLDDIYALIDGVQLGLGNAVLPKHLIQDIKQLEVVNPKTILKLPVYLIYNEASYYTSIQKTVINELIKGFKARLTKS